MTGQRWFELPVEEARGLVAPENLEDVLGELKRDGLINHFRINSNSVTIETSVQSKFQLALFTEEASDFNPIFNNQRK